MIQLVRGDVALPNGSVTHFPKYNNPNEKISIIYKKFSSCIISPISMVLSRFPWTASTQLFKKNTNMPLTLWNIIDAWYLNPFEYVILSWLSPKEDETNKHWQTHKIIWSKIYRKTVLVKYFGQYKSEV